MPCDRSGGSVFENGWPKMTLRINQLYVTKGEYVCILLVPFLVLEVQQLGGEEYGDDTKLP